MQASVSTISTEGLFVFKPAKQEWVATPILTRVDNVQAQNKTSALKGTTETAAVV